MSRKFTLFSSKGEVIKAWDIGGATPDGIAEVKHNQDGSRELKNRDGLVLGVLHPIEDSEAWLVTLSTPREALWS